MVHRRHAAPQAIVIFGASGDLTRRKLLPAFYHLFLEGMLPEKFAIVGYARTDMTDEEFREHARDAVTEFGKREPFGEVWSDFAKHLRYVPGEFSDAGAMRQVAEDLGRHRRDARHGGEPVLLLRDAAGGLSRHRQADRRGRPAGGAQDRVREAVRP